MNKANGFDLGTSPHGLSADLELQYQETHETGSHSLLADKQAPQGRAVGFELPDVYTSPAVLKARSTLEAPGERKPQMRHALELTDREFLHAHSAVEHDRNRTRKAIKKGLACSDDLKATDGLWHKLQTVMFARLPRKGGQA